MEPRLMDESEIRAALVAFKAGNARRNELVRMARDAGISIREIGQLSGLSRNTVYNILGEGGQQ
jgi:DNA invertase Pin-like site-specific DNA recombinase